MSFSVIIPTLQRVAATSALIDDLTGSPHVSEILVINNTGTPLPYDSPKLRELRQRSNIFVNPAWNLGAREAAHDDLCFANDDIRFDVSLFGTMRRALRLPIGILAPREDSFTTPLATEDLPAPRRRLGLTPTYRRTNGFGTLMFMRRESFVPIPESLQVWYGDDFLFHQQRHRNVLFSGVPIHTKMSSTSSSGDFLAMNDAETIAYRQIERGSYEHRFRHDLRVARRARGALQALRRG